MLQSKLLSWIEDDLVKARTMLERFTPTLLPPSSGIDCGASCRQLFYIGGDYYDFLFHPNQTSVFAIGDVSGKGISAALMLANLRAVLHDEMQQDRVNLTGMLSKLNRLVYEASPVESFITFFYAQYDRVRSRLHYVNAGHNPPLLFRSLSKNKTSKELSVGGLPLGAMLNPPIAFEQGRENLRPGDVLVAYTDGITEIKNRSEEEWGVNRLIDTIQRHSDLSSQEIVKQVFNSIDKYAEGTDPIDDMTLIILKALR
jgi:sigma-B regulation protein RsbU (phosphoserine phosphatase)